jgi:predicted nucleic acid-binding protein
MQPQEAKQLLEGYLEYLEAVPLDKTDYQAAIAQMTALNLPGGGIFDALIAQAALKARAERLVTLNAKHFTRLEETLAALVYVPE